MKAPIKHIVLFIILSLIIAQGIHFIFGYSFRHDHFTKIWWSFQKQNQKYDVAILGNSRPLTGVSARFLQEKTSSKVINLAEADIAINSYYLILKRFLTVQKSQVDHVVLNVDLQNLASDAKEDYDKIWNYIPYLNEKEIFNEVNRCYPIRSYLWKYVPLFGYAEFNSKIGPVTLLNSWTKIKKPPFNKYGDRSHKRQIKSIDLSPKIDTLRINVDSEAFDYLKKIASLCFENSIQLYVITMPYYQHNKTIFSNMSLIQNEINKVLSDYNQPNYINMINTIDTEDFTLFSDKIHLNEKGAKLFSRQLIQLLDL